MLAQHDGRPRYTPAVRSVQAPRGVPAMQRSSDRLMSPLAGRTSIGCALGALLLCVSGIASAQNAFTSRPMNVRAGPNREYPMVAQLGPGTPVQVYGCLSDWSWCDASDGQIRGWIYAGGLSFNYQGTRVPLYSYGPSLGLPILTFSLPLYWGRYYRSRPFFSQRNSWAHRRLPPHMRPRGRTHAGPPPMHRAPSGGRLSGHGAFGRPGPGGHAVPGRRGPARAPQSHGPQRPQSAPHRPERPQRSGPTARHGSQQRPGASAHGAEHGNAGRGSASHGNTGHDERHDEGSR